MNTTPTQDLLTRALASLQHLHTLHGPCDGKTRPHTAVIRELESALFTAPSPASVCEFCNHGNPASWYKWNGESIGRILCCDDCWTTFWKDLSVSQAELPPEEVRCPSCGELVKSIFEHVDRCPCGPAEPLSHDPHDLASALIAATTRTREWRDME